ncbi:MAG: helix-turn-helix transcriptional regulator [Oscillospiraceae bacterium]|nr:helix-turn-helix transcriptional regulator [Oscillospiraceae bacterium]
MTNINERIANLIKTLKITRLRFGEEVGLSSSSVSKLCQGDTVPAPSTIKSICRTYNVREEWLVKGNGEMFVAQTEEEELAYLMGVALADERAPFRKKLLKLILELPPEAIDAIEAYGRKLYEETSTDKE